ncbi:MAG: DMT family transporter [Pseudomonadota bacterium]
MFDLSNPSIRLASLAVFVSATVWGLYWVPLRIFDAAGIGGGWSVALLNLPPLLLLGPLLLWQFGAHRSFIGRAVMIGFFAGAGLAFYASGLVYSTVVRTTLLFYLTPVWSTLIGLIWLGERVSWQRWVAIVTGLAGMFLLLSGSGGSSVPLNIGDLLGFLSGIFWAVGAAMIRRFEGVPLVGMTFFQFFFTALIALVCALAFGPREMPELATFASQIPLAVGAALGLILPTVAVIFWAQKFLFPGRVGLLMMSEVLVAVISASIFIPEERMGLVEWIGAAMIIGACLIEVLTIAEKPDAKASREGLV